MLRRRRFSWANLDRQNQNLRRELPIGYRIIDDSNGGAVRRGVFRIG